MPAAVFRIWLFVAAVLAGGWIDAAEQFVPRYAWNGSAGAITDADLDQMALHGQTLDQSIYFQQPASFVPYGAPEPYQAATAEIGPIEILPEGLFWHSYWAGAKEPRTSALVLQDFNGNQTLVDVSLGGRTAVLREGAFYNGVPEGWELQIEGAGILRLNLDHDWDLDAVDFRFGVPVIIARDRLRWKFGYYHLSSHLGDEFAMRPGNSLAGRLNFARDALVAGVSFQPRPAWRWYAETAWAFYADGGSDPWEVQLGLDLAQPGPTGMRGTPFVALNGHLREELNFGGNLVLQAGWLWRGASGRVLRTGLHYYNGKSNQYQFFNEFEQQLGWGLWQEY